MSYIITILATLICAYVFTPKMMKTEHISDLETLESENKSLRKSLILNSEWRKNLAITALKKIQEADSNGVESIVRQTLRNIDRLQIAAGDYFVNPIHVNLSFIVNQECEKLGICNTDIDPFIVGVGGPVKISNAVYEIIINALESGDSDPFVSLKADTDGYYMIKVVNKGHLSEPSYMLKTMYFSTKENRDGLGLCIAESIARSHEGNLTIKNNNGYVEVEMRIKI